MGTERRIELGEGYWLVNDQYCCWISKEIIVKNGKNKGQRYLKRISGYTTCVEDALVSAVNRHVRTKDANSINTLIKEIKSLKSLIKRLNWNLGGDDDA